MRPGGLDYRLRLGFEIEEMTLHWQVRLYLSVVFMYELYLSMTCIMYRGPVRLCNQTKNVFGLVTENVHLLHSSKGPQ